MSDNSLGWTSLMRPIAPVEYRLSAALFTTYDQADERFLAEELLPAVLRLDRNASEPENRRLFIVDLDRRLQELRDRIVVVSSTCREAVAPTDFSSDSKENGQQAPYPWIWRSLRSLHVGRDLPAIQHAKLWMLLWVDPSDPTKKLLEIVVSSANLTRSAFSDQLQAAWRVCLPLEPTRSQARHKSWGVLPAFLDALGQSTGDDANRIGLFTELLSFATCPSGVNFMASVPGKHSAASLRRTPWGSAALKAVRSNTTASTKVSVLSPFVGSWNEKDLAQWCEAAASRPKRFHLIWIDTKHPWARLQRWVLPQSTFDSLNACAGELLHHPAHNGEKNWKGRFHDDHRAEDQRWSHAKVYRFASGRTLRTLITSANFSTSAWGRYGQDGSLTIKNFELGVCVEGGQWPFDQLGAFPPDAVPAVVDDLFTRSSTVISWVDARWTGTKVLIECRCDMVAELIGTVVGTGRTRQVARKHWKVDGNKHLRAEIAWAYQETPPHFVTLKCAGERVCVPVMDERPGDICAIAALEDINPQEREALNDGLLFEQYGGLLAEDQSAILNVEPQIKDIDSPHSDSESQNGVVASGGSDSYETASLVLARRYLGIVDKWMQHWSPWQNVGRYGEMDTMAQRVLNDGLKLVNALGRQAERDSLSGATLVVGARVAKDELQVRLEGWGL